MINPLNPLLAGMANGAFSIAIQQSVHRESGEVAPYLVTALEQQTGLTPSILHCEMDALAVTSWLLRQGSQEPKVLEIRSQRKPLRHENSIWVEEGMNLYAYGIHYVALAGESVFDLQSTLKPGLALDEYLRLSFPDQPLGTKSYWPNDLRSELRLSRSFLEARYNGFKDFPELESDPLEKRPQPLSLRDILRKGQERRLREP